MSAKERIKRIKKAVRGDKGYTTFSDYQLMKEMGWTWDELRETPYEKYLEFKRMKGIEAKEEQKETKRAERKAERAK